MRISILATLLLLSSLPCWPEDAVTPGYSTELLREPIYNEAEVAVGTTKINNWLVANIEKLTPDQMHKPREQLYYLIDSRVKLHYAKHGRVLPAEKDPMLATLFSWAEPLGIYGGSLAFNALKSDKYPAQAPALSLPDGISLTLRGDLFTMKSTAGWSFSFPYYFMVGQVMDTTVKDGSRVQMVVISTGAANDTSEFGKSQATLMFLYSPDPYEAFERFWLGMVGIGPDVAPKELGIRKLTSRHVLDSSLKMHKEFTSWSDSTSSFAVAYLGNEGTYEWNRQHFMDFLQATVIEPVTSPVPHGHGDPKPIASLNEGIRLVRSFEGKPEDFVLVVPESLIDSVGMNVAILTNEALLRGWWPGDVTKKDGYRVFRYKKRERPG